MKLFTTYIFAAALAFSAVTHGGTIEDVQAHKKLSARNALNVLRVASAVVDSETVTVGTLVFEADTTVASGITSGNIRVDLSGGGTTAAAQTLTITALPGNTETVTIDTKVYTFQTTLTNVNGNVALGATAATAAANLVDAINLGPTAGTDYATAMTLHGTVTAALGTAVAASQTLTSDATAPSDGDTVTIGSKVYTFQTTLTNVDGNVLIGASAAAALDNLKAAINIAAGAGTTYATAMTANTQVSAGTNTDTTQVVTALTAGGAANLIATTETSSHLSWGAATLTGGSDKVVVTAKIPGAGANSFATTETVTGSSWGSTTMAGGVSPTAGEFTTALNTAINAQSTQTATPVASTRVSANEILLYSLRNGAVVTACTETLAGSNNAWASATMYGGANEPQILRNVEVVTRTANAVEDALETMHFFFPFTPTAVTVQVLTSAGVPEAFDGAVTITGGRVDVASSGSTDIDATDVVTITVSN